MDKMEILIEQQVQQIILDLLQSMNGQLMDLTNPICKKNLSMVMLARGYPAKYIDSYISSIGSNPIKATNMSAPSDTVEMEKQLFHRHIKSANTVTPDQQSGIPMQTGNVTKPNRDIDIEQIQNEQQQEYDQKIDVIFKDI